MRTFTTICALLACATAAFSVDMSLGGYIVGMDIGSTGVLACHTRWKQDPRVWHRAVPDQEDICTVFIPNTVREVELARRGTKPSGTIIFNTTLLRSHFNGSPIFNAGARFHYGEAADSYLRQPLNVATNEVKDLVYCTDYKRVLMRLAEHYAMMGQTFTMDEVYRVSAQCRQLGTDQLVHVPVMHAWLHVFDIHRKMLNKTLSLTNTNVIWAVPVPVVFEDTVLETNFFQEISAILDIGDIRTMFEPEAAAREAVHWVNLNAKYEEMFGGNKPTYAMIWELGGGSADALLARFGKLPVTATCPGDTVQPDPFLGILFNGQHRWGIVNGPSYVNDWIENTTMRILNVAAADAVDAGIAPPLRSPLQTRANIRQQADLFKVERVGRKDWNSTTCPLQLFGNSLLVYPESAVVKLMYPFVKTAGLTSRWPVPVEEVSSKENNWVMQHPVQYLQRQQIYPYIDDVCQFLKVAYEVPEVRQDIDTADGHIVVFAVGGGASYPEWQDKRDECKTRALGRKATQVEFADLDTSTQQRAVVQGAVRVTLDTILHTTTKSSPYHFGHLHQKQKGNDNVCKISDTLGITKMNTVFENLVPAGRPFAPGSKFSFNWTQQALDGIIQIKLASIQPKSSSGILYNFSAPVCLADETKVPAGRTDYLINSAVKSTVTVTLPHDYNASIESLPLTKYEYYWTKVVVHILPRRLKLEVEVRGVQSENIDPVTGQATKLGAVVLKAKKLDKEISTEALISSIPCNPKSSPATSS